MKGGGEPAPIAESANDILATTDAGPAAIRGGTLRTFGYVISGLVGAVGAAFLARHLGSVGLGIYVTATALTTIVAGVSDLGLTALGLRELSVRPERARAELMRNMLGIRIVVSLVGVGTVVAFSVGVGYRQALIAGVAVAGFAIVLQSVQVTLSLSLMSRLRLGWVTALEVARQVVLTGLIILLVQLGSGVVGFLALQIPIALGVLLATVLLVYRDTPLRPSFDRHQWRLLLRDILPFSVAAALGVIYFRVSVVAVSLIVGARELGYFNLSFRIIEVLIGIPALMVTAAFPIFSRAAIDDRERLAYALERVFEVAVVVGAWFALALALGAPVPVHLIGGPKVFDQSIPILRLQAIGLGGSFISVLWMMALLALRRRREVIWISAGALVLGIILVTILGELDGARGAAIATAAVELALAAIGPLVLARAGRSLVPSFGVVPRVALAVVVAAALGILVGGGPLVRVAVASLAYGAVAVIARALPRELLIEVRRLSELRPRRAA